MSSLKRKEGWLMLDHRNSPGLPEDIAHATQPDLPVSFGRGLFECPTVTCSHCEAMVVLNPLRNRERAYCAKCDSYICDHCAARRQAGAECKPFKQLVDEVQEAAFLELQRKA